VREFEFLQSAELTLLTERRRHVPWGLAGGVHGRSGRNWKNDVPLPGKVHLTMKAGDRLKIETPGGGGWGLPETGGESG